MWCREQRLLPLRHLLSTMVALTGRRREPRSESVHVILTLQGASIA
uniref:Uncharacterized protein n=1 Tax=Parascaris univalens TaxID=6257 RepID=A0A915A418_PARUN